MPAPTRGPDAPPAPTHAVVEAVPGGPPHGAHLVFQGERLACAVGRMGITAEKREGDLATPAGVLAIRRTLFRADRIDRTMLAAHAARPVPLEPIGPSDGWCDDPGHPDYNRMVGLPHPARAERMWRDDGLYDVVCVLGHNDAPVERGRGSAIFLHVATDDLGPTEGCVALPLAALLRLLGRGLAGLVIRAPEAGGGARR